MTALAASLLTLGALIQRLEDHGLLEEREWCVREKPQSPWIEIDVTPAVYEVVTHGHVLTDPPTYRFAILRETAALYVVGPDGAVIDGPISIDEAP